MRPDVPAEGAPAAPTDPPDLLRLRVPPELAPWVRDFILEADRQNRFLRDNGASEAAAARGHLLVSLVEEAQRWLDGEVDVAAAAAAAGCCEETVRRAVRQGTIPDRRSDGRGRHRVRRGDLPRISAAYDPARDAEAIAAGRKKR